MSRSRGAVHLWEETELVVDDKGALWFKERRFENAKSERAHRYGDPARVAAELRGTYADALERRIADLAAYAARQRERIAGWAPRELQPA